MTVNPKIPVVPSKSVSAPTPIPVFESSSLPIHFGSEFLDSFLPSSNSAPICSSPLHSSPIVASPDISAVASTVESTHVPGPFHSMRTRSKSGIFKPRHPLTLLTSVPSSSSCSPSLTTREPSHFFEAIHHHVWQKAMAEEYEALIKQGTYLASCSSSVSW